MFLSGLGVVMWFECSKFEFWNAWIHNWFWFQITLTHDMSIIWEKWNLLAESQCISHNTVNSSHHKYSFWKTKYTNPGARVLCIIQYQHNTWCNINGEFSYNTWLVGHPPGIGWGRKRCFWRALAEICWLVKFGYDCETKVFFTKSGGHLLFRRAYYTYYTY